MRTRPEPAPRKVVAIDGGAVDQRMPAGEVRSLHVRRLLERDVLPAFKLTDEGHIAEPKALAEAVTSYLERVINGDIQVGFNVEDVILYLTLEDSTGQYVNGFALHPDAFGLR